MVNRFEIKFLGITYLSFIHNFKIQDLVIVMQDFVSGNTQQLPVSYQRWCPFKYETWLVSVFRVYISRVLILYHLMQRCTRLHDNKRIALSAVMFMSADLSSVNTLHLSFSRISHSTIGFRTTLTHWCRVNVLSAGVFFCEICLHTDGTRSTQPTRSQLVSLYDLIIPLFLEFSGFFHITINIDDVLHIDITIM